MRAAVQRVADALGGGGRILVRESGTEPLIRVMAEADEKSKCTACVDVIVEVIRRQGHCAE